jgi:hypothetical protein
VAELGAMLGVFWDSVDNLTGSEMASRLIALLKNDSIEEVNQRLLAAQGEK